MSEEKKAAALDESALDAVTGGTNGFGPLNRFSGKSQDEIMRQLGDQANQQLRDILQRQGEENEP